MFEQCGCIRIAQLFFCACPQKQPVPVRLRFFVTMDALASDLLAMADRLHVAEDSLSGISIEMVCLHDSMGDVTADRNSRRLVHCPFLLKSCHATPLMILRRQVLSRLVTRSTVDFVRVGGIV